MKGRAEDLYGQAVDAAGSVGDIVYKTIEERPYTAVVIAFGLGRLYGRTSSGCSLIYSRALIGDSLPRFAA